MKNWYNSKTSLWILVIFVCDFLIFDESTQFGIDRGIDAIWAKKKLHGQNGWNLRVFIGYVVGNL